MAAAITWFHHTTGSAAQSLECKGTGPIYKAMLKAELPGARAYLTERLRSRNLNPDDFFDNIARIPRESTDHHRSNTLLWVLNGLATAHRVSVFRSDVVETACKFCGSGSDDIAHLVECPVVRQCVAVVVQQHVFEHPGDAANVSIWPPCAHFLQGNLSPQQMLLIMRVNSTIWHVRCAVANGYAFADVDDLLRHLVRLCCDPILHKRTRKLREIVEPQPLPHGAVLYRSDGAARGQGQDGLVKSGAGAVFYCATDSVLAWCCVNLSDVSNNVAEYVGALLVLERVVRMSQQHAVLEMDSMLVTNQLLGKWRVGDTDLVSYFRKASLLLHQIRRQGKQIDIRHVYREFNKDADAKANLGADGITANDNW